MESKGLEALEELKGTCDLLDEGHQWDKEFSSQFDEKFDIIENELKQAEENEKLLNAFRNALTIEHHDYPMVEQDHNRDTISCLAKEQITIRQNELDKSMRKALREWVLKNAFPKELKALEIISKAYGNYANYKISDYELIMVVGENTTY